MERSNYGKERGPDRGQVGGIIDGRKAKIAAAIGLLVGLGIVGYEVGADSTGSADAAGEQKFETPDLGVEAVDPELNRTLQCLWARFDDVMGCGGDYDDFVEADCDTDALDALEDGTDVVRARDAAMKEAGLPVGMFKWIGSGRPEYATCERSIDMGICGSMTPEQRGQLRVRQRR